MTANRNHSQLLRPAGLISGLTLGSRILGLGRDLAIAAILGAGVTTDVFLVAFRIPALCRRLYSEGTLSMVYMPELGRARTSGQPGRFASAAGMTLGFAATTFGGLCLLGMVAAPLLVLLLAPGFKADEGTYWRAVVLTRQMLPYVFLAGVAAAAMAVLNSQGRFAAPAAGPGLLNLSVIGGALIALAARREPTSALAMAVIAGGILQIAVQLPWLWRQVAWRQVGGWWRHPVANTYFAGLVAIGLGAAVHHLNIFVATLFASWLRPGSIAALYFADRLIQLPLGLVAAALAIAVLPELSRLAAADDFQGFRKATTEALEMALVVAIPAAVGLWQLRGSIVTVLFEHGAFSRQGSLMTAEALAYLAPGLWALAAGRILMAACFGLGRPRDVIKVGALSLLLNGVLCGLLIQPMAHAGLALATSVAAVANMVLLLVVVSRRSNGLPFRSLLATGGRSLAAAALMAAALLCLQRSGLLALPGSSGVDRALELGLKIIAGVAVYFGAMLLLGLRASLRAWDVVWHRPGGREGNEREDGGAEENRG